MRRTLKKLYRRIKQFFTLLGPGIITGAAGDDPSGIATYAQTGAQFGYGQLWANLFILPFLTAVQEACSRIGAVTGKGVAGVIKAYFNPLILHGTVLLVFLANTINISVNLGAMAAAAQLLYPFNFTLLIFIFACAIVLLEVLVSYRVYSNYLKWLALFLLAYPLSVFLVKQPWAIIFKATFLPKIEFNFEFFYIITGVLGTTISPYLFFWQSSQVVEEGRELYANKPNRKPHINWSIIKHNRLDSIVGMFFSQFCAWTIMILTATVLNTNGITDIKTSADAAKALEPFIQTFPHAGFIAKAIFAIGILGLGFLSIPVLAGSSAYAICESWHWREGLNLKPKQARGFYTIIVLSTFIGLLINCVGIDPFKALIFSAVINGIVAVPLLFLIAKISQSKLIMGRYKSSLVSKILVWITCLGMFLSVLAMLVSFVLK